MLRIDTWVTYRAADCVGGVLRDSAEILASSTEYRTLQDCTETSFMRILGSMKRMLGNGAVNPK